MHLVHLAKNDVSLTPYDVQRTVKSKRAPSGELFQEDFRMVRTSSKHQAELGRRFSLFCQLEQYTGKAGERTSPGVGD
jgi:hypothetical protein